MIYLKVENMSLERARDSSIIERKNNLTAIPSNLADVKRSDSVAAKEWSGEIRVATWKSV
jgi:hypothetical protein